MGNGIFQFGCSAFDGITGRTILAEVYPTFTETEAEEFLILLSKLVDVEYLVADDSVIGRHSIICQANVNDFEQVNRMRDEVVKQFGRL